MLESRKRHPGVLIKLLKAFSVILLTMWFQIMARCVWSVDAPADAGHFLHELRRGHALHARLCLVASVQGMLSSWHAVRFLMDLLGLPMCILSFQHGYGYFATDFPTMEEMLKARVLSKLAADPHIYQWSQGQLKVNTSLFIHWCHSHLYCDACLCILYEWITLLWINFFAVYLNWTSLLLSHCSSQWSCQHCVSAEEGPIWDHIWY